MNELTQIRREHEMIQLWQAYQDLEKGNCQLRFIAGEAGTGKSVLMDMFVKELEEKAENTLVASTFCCIRSEYSIPYQPFKELLKQLLQEVRQEEELVRQGRSRKERLKEAFAFSGRMLLEHAPDLIDNFIPFGTVIGAIGQHFLGKEEEKTEKGTVPDEAKIIEEYINTLRAISEKYCLVLLIDDLQWIDKPSVNLLYQLSVALRKYPVLIVGSYRSTDIDVALDGEKHPMDKLINEVKITYGNVFIHLDNIDIRERRKLMDALLDRESNVYDAAFRKTLFERTGGNPLFVSEMVNLLKEEGILEQNEMGIWSNREVTDWQSYPVRIEGIIRERIGRLEDSMVEILSQASVQGYRFIVQVLSRTMGETERDLLMTLSRKLQKQYHLVSEGPCVRSAGKLVSEFNFSNYIFQQYLYQELSATQRMILHGDIAVILEELYQDKIEEVAGDIARHYELAGEPGKALKYIEMAVEQMMAVAAHREASVLLDKALGPLAEGMDEHTRLRLMVKQSLCFRSVMGWANSATERMYTESEELMNKLGSFEYADVIWYGQWSICMVKLELGKCMEFAKRILDTAEKKENPVLRMTGFITLANTYYWQGDFLEAEKALEQYVKLAGNLSGQHMKKKENDFFYELFCILVSFQLGKYEQTAASKMRLTKMMEETPDRFCQAVGYQALAWVEFLAGNRSRSGEYARKLLEVSEAGGYLFYIAVGYFFEGAAMAVTDEVEGMKWIQKGNEMFRDDTGLEIFVMHSLYGLVLGTVYIDHDRLEELGKWLEKIIAESKEKGELCYLGELYVLGGRYEQLMNHPEQASFYFQQAEETVKRSGAMHVNGLIRKFNG